MVKGKKLKFSLRRRKVLFSKGPIRLVDCEVAMPNGRILSRQILEHPGAVVIVPKADSGKYLLIRQFRFAARDWLWEFPAGGLEAGESQEEAARRELMEETGFGPRRLKKILEFYPTPGVSGEVMHVFLAGGLFPARGKPDEDEEIEVREFTLAQIGRMVRSKAIVDAKTLLGYFYLKLHP